MIKVSVFDLDHTLCQGNLSFQFGIYLYKEGFLSFLSMVVLLSYYFLHKLGLLSIINLHHKVCYYFFRGKSVNDIKNQVERFLDKNLDQLLNPSVFELLKKAKSNQEYLILLSSSPDFLVQRVAERLNLDEWRATAYAITGDGTISHVLQPITGKDKANFIKSLSKRLDISRTNITAYSDSWLDIEFLEEVGKPIAVNPDRHLYKLCKKKGWKVHKST